MTKVKEISVNVSKKIGLPNYSSAMISASITTTVDEGDNLDMAYSANWDVCWKEIDKQEKNLKDLQKLQEGMVKENDPDFGVEKEEKANTEDNVVCPIHHVKMTHFVKEDSDWWSHKVGDGWCSGVDNKKNRSL